MRKLLLLTLCLLLGACNLPIADSDDGLNDEAATVVALTLAVQGTSTPKDVPLASPTLAPSKSIGPTLTPTYSVPKLNVNETTNCRTGPGESFKLITSFTPGASLEIVGRYPVNNYWVVKIPGTDDTCWIWGDYSTAVGSYWAVPSVTPPATPEPSELAKPGSLTYTYECTFNGVNSDVKVTLGWTDKSGDELGFRVFRDDANISELPANSTTYTETIAANATQKLTYSVAAYNAAGESARATISFSCQ